MTFLYYIKRSFDIGDQCISVLDIDLEFFLQRIVNMDAKYLKLPCEKVSVSVFIGESCLEGNWHIIPSLGVYFSQFLCYAVDDALSG